MTSEEKKKLLTLARSTIKEYLNSGRISDFLISEPALLAKRGAFVTLKQDAELRGCIGKISSEEPVYQTIQEMAIQAALNDPRFKPVDKEELDKIEIEISILSEIKRINDINEIEVGKHGILMRQGFNSGLLLPQVASGYKWSREEFLMHTCYKAGIAPDAWKKKDTQIYIFSAEAFSDNSN